jgi:hypothetical protein
MAELAPSAALLTVIVTGVGDRTTGAVNKPLSRITPRLADQITAVFLVFDAKAANCCLVPEARVPEEGEMLILTPGVTFWLTALLGGEMPAQPVEK